MLLIKETIELDTIRKIMDSAKKQIKQMPETFFSTESVVEALNDIERAIEQRAV